MPLQNRVDPFGTLQAVPARGDMMGNRGILHDTYRQVVKTHAHQNWVSCTLSHKGRQRQIMAPRAYTELFFLDEATALAAGHRPCATCRRDSYRAFTEIWKAVHGGARDGRSLPQTIDRDLHAARIWRGQKVTVQANADTLPDGTMIADGDTALLLWDGQALPWSFDGYESARKRPSGRVEVLTPEPLMAVLAAGYRPAVHASAT